jgi:acyl dehydratase
MAVTSEQLMALKQQGIEVKYTSKDAMLYALSLGIAREGADENVLPFVYEGRTMKTLPTFATTLMRAVIPDSGLDFRGVLHGEQRLSLGREIPAEGTMWVNSGVVSVVDKGPEKGSIVTFESNGFLAGGEQVFSTQIVIFARRDGGIGNAGTPMAALQAVPDRAPDHVLTRQGTIDQALLYRLNDDRNPLHADPKIAQSAGFDRPILHGLCTYGMASEAIVTDVLGSQSARVASFDARFAAPVFPGEKLEVDVWRDADVLWFRCRVPERNVVVLDYGRCQLRAA